MARDIGIDEKPKRRGRGTGKFFLGWFLSLIFNLGLLVGLGFWAYKNVTISGVEKTFGFEIGVLSADAKHMTVESLIGKVVDVATNYDEMTLEEIADGVGIGLREMLTVEGTGDNRTYAYKSIDITAVIKGKLNEAGANMETILDDLSLANIEDAFGISLPNYEFLNALKNTPINDIGSATDGIFDSYTLNKLSTEFGLTFNNVEMLSSLLDTPFSELPAEMKNLTVSDVLDTTGATGVLNAIKGYKINELGTKINTIKLGELFDSATINGNSVLKALQNSTINGLSDAIDGLTVADVYPSTTNRVLQAISSYSITNLTAAFDTLTIGDVVDIERKANTAYVPGTDPLYKQYEAQGIWAYIPADTLLKEMNNIEPNLAEKTLGELQYQGLIDQTLDLTKSFEGAELSTYTMNGLIDKITKLTA